MREGLELVRIGDPLRPEIAAWRYGDQFGRRRRRTIILTGVGVAAVGAVTASVAAAGIGIGGLGGFWQLPHIINQGRVRVKLRAAGGRVLHVRGADLQRTRLTTEDGVPLLTVPHKNGKAERFRAGEALRAASVIMPAINRAGGGKAAVAAAVEHLERMGTAEAFLQTAARRLQADARYRKPRPLNQLPTPSRLAIEMALHEEQERRALEGELKVLERAWQEAERIASIADGMFIDDTTEQQLAELKSRKTLS